MAYDPDRNLNPTTPASDYQRTTIEREGSGVTWVVIGLLFAAIVAAIFFLFRPGAESGGEAVITDPTLSTPADPIIPPTTNAVDGAVDMAPVVDPAMDPAPAAPMQP